MKYLYSALQRITNQIQQQNIYTMKNTETNIYKNTQKGENQHYL